MAKAVLENEEVAKYIKHPSARPEVSIVSVEKVKGLDIVCKGRCDLITMDGTVIVDLKTCMDASEEGFSKSFMQMGYWMQAAHYLAIAKNSGMKIERFIFVAVEKTPPYCSALYELDAQSLEKATAIRNKLVETLSDCIARNDFPAYQKNIKFLSMPHWIQ
jgi:exodeoxyribonuclease VIII